MKAINNLAGPDDIIPTLLIFEAYSYITKNSPLLLSITEWTKAIYKAIKEVLRLYAKRQVKNALTIRNSLNTESLLILYLQLNMQVWCKKDKWNRPYTLLVRDGQICII